MDADETGTLIERLPRHRARRRSPLRAGAPTAGAETLPTPDPFGPAKPVDAQAAAALVEGARALAEVADLALTATALILREIEAKLPRPSERTTERED